MIGAFYQPLCVLADTDTLATLPDRELSAGLAEVIKYGLIRDLPFLEWLEANLEALLAREAAALSEAIERSCRNKAEIVAADERETGERALLNLGHTFGHAIETGVGYGEWLHGEAVATGMVMAADLSARLGGLSQEQVDRVRRLLARAGLPLQPPPELTPDDFLRLMAVDKKVKDGQLRLILLRELGQGIIAGDVDVQRLRETLEQAFFQH
jgi:3-dehydroquinate synthase